MYPRLCTLSCVVQVVKNSTYRTIPDPSSTSVSPASCACFPAGPLDSHETPGFMNQENVKATPKVAAKQTKTVWEKDPTVDAYIKLNMSGAITLPAAWSKPSAPRSWPVRSGGTCLVRALCSVGLPMPGSLSATSCSSLMLTEMMRQKALSLPPILATAPQAMNRFPVRAMA